MFFFPFLLDESELLASFSAVSGVCVFSWREKGKPKHSILHLIVLSMLKEQPERQPICSGCLFSGFFSSHVIAHALPLCMEVILLWSRNILRNLFCFKLLFFPFSFLLMSFYTILLFLLCHVSRFLFNLDVEVGIFGACKDGWLCGVWIRFRA